METIAGTFSSISETQISCLQDEILFFKFFLQLLKLAAIFTLIVWFVVC